MWTYSACFACTSNVYKVDRVATRTIFSTYAAPSLTFRGFLPLGDLLTDGMTGGLFVPRPVSLHRNCP